jgi:hypothetical protein
MVDIWEPHTPQIRIAALARGLLVLLLLYWGCFAAVVPVTVWDSQAYNVARLPLALLGGLFGNPYWNDSRQAAFPWGFDAIHLPFCLSDGGFAIPSFFCFLGTLCIVYALRIRHRHFVCPKPICRAYLPLPSYEYKERLGRNVRSCGAGFTFSGRIKDCSENGFSGPWPAR